MRGSLAFAFALIAASGVAGATSDNSNGSQVFDVLRFSLVLQI